jgi:hypothetical protein
MTGREPCKNRAEACMVRRPSSLLRERTVQTAQQPCTAMFVTSHADPKGGGPSPPPLTGGGTLAVAWNVPGRLG